MSTSAAGIVTGADGRREIPESRRADGSIRPAIKVRPGYTPPEDVAKYRPLFRRRAEAAEAKSAESAESGRLKNVPSTSTPATTSTTAPQTPARPVSTTAGAIPGMTPVATGPTEVHTTASAARNSKRREARKKAAESKAEARPEKPTTAAEKRTEQETEQATKTEVKGDDLDKKARGLKKKLKQAAELQAKREAGAALLPEQAAKADRVADLLRELEKLGLGDEK